MTTENRATWTNRLTYVLTVAGATIGFGATWRFPYLVGQNGGGAYVLVFIIAMFLIGIPVILVENVIGRRMKTNSIDAFGGKLLNGKPVNPAWRNVGYLGLLGCFGIMAYYMVLGGWVITYIVNILFGNFDLGSPVTGEYTSQFYNENIEHSPYLIIFYTFLFVVVNWYILKKGIIDGIEKSITFLMPTLFICFCLVIARNLTLDGASAGVQFYLTPDLSKINGKLFLTVLGQVFFALSLGFGVIITLSSYLDKGEDLVKTASLTAFVNTIIAIGAGFMIFPVLATTGLSPDAGPSLVFKTLPVAFSHIPFGTVVAFIFFVLLLIAALTTSVANFQVLVNVFEEKFGYSTTKATTVTLLGTFILGNIPCALAYGPWSEVRFLGMNIFDAFDFVSGNILFVLTALLCCIYVGWVLKRDSVYELSNQGTMSSKVFNVWYNYVKYVVPVIIFIIFVSGLGII